MMNICEYRDCKDENLRRDFEEHVFDNVFNCFLSTLPLNPPAVDVGDANVIVPDVWTDGTEILCRTEYIANRIAKALDAIAGSPESHTGYYDPYDDAQEPLGPFDTTGWWYVDFD